MEAQYANIAQERLYHVISNAIYKANNPKVCNRQCRVRVVVNLVPYEYDEDDIKMYLYLLKYIRDQHQNVKYGKTGVFDRNEDDYIQYKVEKMKSKRNQKDFKKLQQLFLSDRLDDDDWIDQAEGLYYGLIKDEMKQSTGYRNDIYVNPYHLKF